jgi:FKBP-type peptidyl-prolyl cis-trans isomerase
VRVDEAPAGVVTREKGIDHLRYDARGGRQMAFDSRMGSTILFAALASVLFGCSPAEQPSPGGEIVLETEDDKSIYALGMKLSTSTNHLALGEAEKEELRAGFADALHGRESAVDANLAAKGGESAYAWGIRLSRNLDHLPLSESEKNILQSGLADGLYGREPRVDPVRYGRKADMLFERRNMGTARADSGAQEAFLEKAAAAEGAVRTDSGLVMVVLSPGEGPSPGPTDRVRVHYHGTLHDGTVFDSSVARGDPIVFPLNRVIPCWIEALQKMKVGEKSFIVCPSDIAYGDQGSPPLIKPGAALAFEVELLEVLR